MIDKSENARGTVQEKVNPIAVQCENVLVSFFKGSAKKQTVLQGLDLEVPDGKIVSLLGASGCGKSTLLRVIAGLIPPDSGSVAIFGKPSCLSDRAMRLSMSFVFQESALLPWRSVRENVALPLELRGELHRSASTELIEHWLNAVGLKKEDWTKRPSQLSGGMKMRASIARAMTTHPSILLMDEPFAALDDVLRSKLNDLLLKIVAEQRCTVLFVTHNIGEAIYISDRVAVMEKGLIRAEIPVSFHLARNTDLRRSGAFADLYGTVSDLFFESAS